MNKEKLTDSLFKAADSAHFERIIPLLKKGADVNGVTNNQTILMLAASSPYPHIVKTLLDYGADVNQVTPNGSALSLASASWHDHRPEIMGLLLDNGADVNAIDRYQRTALHYAALHHSPEKSQILLAHNANPNALSSLNESPLSNALSFSHWPVAQLLMEKGASPDPFQLWFDKELDSQFARKFFSNFVRDFSRFDLAPLVMAASNSNNDPAGVLLLLKHGLAYDACPVVLNTALLNACINRSAVIVAELLNLEPDLNFQDKWERRPLIEAARKGADAVIEALLKNGALPNLKARGSDSPLHAAAGSKMSTSRTVLLLLEAGADPAALNDNGLSAMDIALHQGRPDLVELLNRSCGSGNVPDNPELFYSQLLMYARSGDCDNIKGLIEDNKISLRPDIDNGAASTSSSPFPGEVPAEAFVKALRNQKTDICALFLEYGLPPDSLWNDIPLICHVAMVVPCQLEVLDCLIDAGASLNVSGSSRSTPFHFLCGKADSDHAGYDRPYFYAKHSLNHIHRLLEKMISNGADINCGDEHSSPLMAAIHWRPYKTVNLLLKHGADANFTDSNGNTPLMIAASLSDSPSLGKIKSLLRYKADISIKNKLGQSVFSFASGSRNKKVFDFLLVYKNKMASPVISCADIVSSVEKISLADFKAIYNPMSHSPAECCDVVDLDCNTPLIQAARFNRRDILSFLIEKGFPLDCRNRSGFSALEVAVMHFRDDAALILLDAGADAEETDKCGRSLLFFAVSSFNANMVNLLLERGCNAKCVDDHNCSLLMSAAGNVSNSSVSENAALVFDCLIRNGVAPDTVDCDENSALMLASGMNNYIAYTAELDGIKAAVRLLVEAGANVGRANKDGKTALHAAAFHNYIQCCALLLRAGADGSLKDRFGLTPVDYARKNGHKNLVDFFVHAHF
ncbi:MAG: hypothetical protein GY757_06315 [bacterium]|nr:hypothetical protein [bacterium]